MKATRPKIKKTCFLPTFLVLLFACTNLCAFNRDPIEETQTKPVPVTEELLTREGELGPAAPTYKMPEETSKFLVKEPYEKAETQYLGEVLDLDKEDNTLLSDEWFFWDKQGEQMSETEVIDKK